MSEDIETFAINFRYSNVSCDRLDGWRTTSIPDIQRYLTKLSCTFYIYWFILQNSRHSLRLISAAAKARELRKATWSVWLVSNQRGRARLADARIYLIAHGSNNLSTNYEEIRNVARIKYFACPCLSSRAWFDHDFATFLFTFLYPSLSLSLSLASFFCNIHTKLIDFQSVSVITRVNDRTWRHAVRTPESRMLWNCRLARTCTERSDTWNGDNRSAVRGTAITPLMLDFVCLENWCPPYRDPPSPHPSPLFRPPANADRPLLLLLWCYYFFLRLPLSRVPFAAYLSRFPRAGNRYVLSAIVRMWNSLSLHSVFTGERVVPWNEKKKKRKKEDTPSAKFPCPRFRRWSTWQGPLDLALVSFLTVFNTSYTL